MSTTNEQVISAFAQYSSDIIRVLGELLEILNTNKITLTFDTGTDIQLNPMVVYRGQSFGNLPNPTRPGYEFLGWYLTKVENSFGIEYSNEIKDYSEVLLTSSVTLYAKWDYAHYRIELNAMGGTVVPSYVEAQYMQLITDLPIPEKLGHKFLHWNSISGSSDDNGTISCNFYGDPLSAVYAEIPNTLSFFYAYDLSAVPVEVHLPSGWKRADSWEVKQAGMYPSFAVLSVFPSETRFIGDVTLSARNNLKAVGHRFKGWSDSKNSPDLLTTIRPITNTALYAYWEPIQYTVRYNYPSGSILSGEVETYGVPFGILANEDLLDKATAERLQHWNVPNGVWGKTRPSDLTVIEKHYVDNMVTVWHQPEYMDLTAVMSATSYLGGGPNASAEAIVKLEQNPAYKYVISDDIHVSGFRALVRFGDGKYRWRTPLYVNPPKLTTDVESGIASGLINFRTKEALSDDWSSPFTYPLCGEIPSYPVEYKLLSDDIPLQQYTVGDYPNLGDLKICVVDNYGVSSYNYDYGYSPTNKFNVITTGNFIISAYDSTLEHTVSTWTLSFDVAGEIDYLELSTNEQFISSYYTGDQLSIDGIDVAIHWKNTIGDSQVSSLREKIGYDAFSACFTPIPYPGGDQLDEAISTVYIDYQNFSVSYPITVEYEYASMSAFELTHYPNKMFYLQGETFDNTGISGIAKYTSGKEIVVSSDNITYYDVPLNGIGKTPVTVYCADKTAEVSVLISYSNLINVFGGTFSATSTYNFSGLSSFPDVDVAVDFHDVATISDPNVSEQTKEKFYARLGSHLIGNNSLKHTFVSPQNNISVYTQIPGVNQLSSGTNITENFANYVNTIEGNVPVGFLLGNPSSKDKITLKNSSLSTTSIGDNSFKNCTSLNVITFNGNVDETLTEIGSNAFNGASNLSSFGTSGSNKNGCYIPSEITKISDSAFKGNSKFNVLDCSNAKKMNEIGDFAFENNNFTSVFWKDCENLSIFGKGIFKDCVKLSAIDGFPEKLREIPANMFNGCSKLPSVDFDNIDKIGDYAFAKCFNLSSIEFSDVTELGNNAFDGCNLTSIDFKHVSKIGSSAFANCTKLSSYESLFNIGEIPSCAFYNSGLKKIYIGDNVNTIGEKAFCNCGNWISAYIPYSVSFIGPSAFYHNTAMSLLFACSKSYAERYLFPLSVIGNSNLKAIYNFGDRPS